MNSSTVKNRTAAKATVRVSHSNRGAKSVMTLVKKDLQSKKNLATLLLGANPAEMNNQF